MVSDEIYDICLPILRDEGLNEEEKTDKLEGLLVKEATLSGRALQDAILSILWRYRDATVPTAASPPPRVAIARRGSPAPWQVPRAATPLASPPLGAASPVSSHGIFSGPAFPRSKPANASPFTSPRPSPRLAFASPIPHSPSLNTYEFSEPTTARTDYGDYGSDNVDWLVAEEDLSRPTSSSATSAFESSLSAAAAPWIQPQQSEMSPYDMLRSILGESKTDEEIEAALESNGYDLSATVTSFMGSETYEDPKAHSGVTPQVTVGKSMQSSQPIPIGLKGAGKSPVICKYWLATGNCLRSDCRFSHDYGTHICKYWIMGNCLAGDTCVFSHDPSALMANMNLGGSQPAGDSAAHGQPSFQIQDYDSFPSLHASAGNSWAQGAGGRSLAANSSASPRSYGSRPGSRPTSRAATPSLPLVDDAEAFPALGQAGAKGVRKHHGKRGGHGHSSQSKETLQEMRMSPSPSPSLLRRGLVKSKSYVGNINQQAASAAIPPPEHIPWLETGDSANHAYIKARHDAFKHGGLRNKFLQSAAQAWNRNDARAAKALSLRGQSENELMRKAHREAARVLYDSCSKQVYNASHASSGEIYVDLHGLHPDESIAYLSRILREQKSLGRAQDEDELRARDASNQAAVRPIYAITGTGHHSKGGKDKVGKAIRVWLSERNFTFREFSVPGDRGNVGGILGIDVTTGSFIHDDHTSSHEKTHHSEASITGSDTLRMEAGTDVGIIEGGDSDITDLQSAKGDGHSPGVQMRIPTGPKGLRV